jgi:anti-sigma factor RsiW
MNDGHYGEELQDLLDRRLEPDRARELETHLEGCAECRALFDGLALARRAVREAPPADLPAGLEASIRDVLRREEAPRSPRRQFLAAAAGLVLAAGGLTWYVRRARSLPGAVARDYARFRSGRLTLDTRDRNAEAVEAFFRDRPLGFRARVIDLGMMGFELAGATVNDLDGRPAALFVYVGGPGTLVCQMFEGRLPDLPDAQEVREHRGFRFLAYEEGAVTVVFWQEGAVLCALAGDFARDEVMALALEKAMA